MNVLDVILKKIERHHALSFAEFMQMALYDPSGGYYTMGLSYFGQDFTTSPQISPLFAACLATQTAEVCQSMTKPCILEFGAGSGRLCIDMLTHLETLGCLPESYTIIELSGRLQAQQRQTIAHEIPHLYSKIQWLDSWPKTPFEGVIIANEVLDAMPVHRFLKTDKEVYEIFVTANSERQLCEVLKICDNDVLRTQVNKVLPSSLFPYQSEVNLLITDWLDHCAKVLKRGMMLIIDYGFPQAEYYHPDRNEGTIMCHYQHRTHPNPLSYVGEQDISAHVDFTLVAEAAVAAGFSVAGYTSQAAFLLATGLLTKINASDPEQLFRQQQAVKMLTHPSEMGELFKVMALGRDWDEPLQGFQLQDRRASL